MLGMAAAGFLQGWSNGKVNMMPMFEKMIDQDFQRQKAEGEVLKTIPLSALEKRRAKVPAGAAR